MRMASPIKDDNSTDSVNLFLNHYMNSMAIMPATPHGTPGFETVEQLETIPGEHKSFTISYPVKEYRQITVKARSLKEALIKADKRLKSRNKKHPNYANRIGDFKIYSVVFSNFKDRLSLWGNAWVKKIMMHTSPIIEPHICTGQMYAKDCKSVEVPDDYWNK